MKWINAIVVLLISMTMWSCHDKPAPFYTNRIAQDPSYRIGKWYSITDSGTTSQTHNTNLDTIWFINDTLAGWTGFVPYQPRTYVFWQTYFTGGAYIVYIAPDALNPSQIDTVSHQCAMNGDTLTIWWDLTTPIPQTEEYLKMK